METAEDPVRMALKRVIYGRDTDNSTDDTDATRTLGMLSVACG